MELNKVYIITLDHSTENIASLMDRLSVLTVPNTTEFEIINGVDGKSLLNTAENRERYGVSLYEDWNIGGTQWMWNRNVTVGEAGGVCSHIKIWEDAHTMGYDNILVLEDDFQPTTEFNWESFSELSKYDWDIAFLSRLLQGQLSGIFGIDIYDSEIGLESWVKPGYSYQTHAYVVSKSGLNKIIKDHLPTLKNNIIVSDEFLPATYTVHPRKDIRDMYIQNINAVAYRWDYIQQTRNIDTGDSQTEPIEGIDY
jgi:glycosyl transferase family 25